MQRFHPATGPSRLAALSTIVGGLTLAAPLVLPREALAQCAPRTFTVDSTGDASDVQVGDGICATGLPAMCTLRAAIQEANVACAPTTIRFDIPGSGTRIIAIGTTPLPVLTRETVIDGTTQPGASPNTAPLLEPGNAVLRVEIRGNLETTYGLATYCPDGDSRPSVIRGLVLNGFGSYAFLNQRCDGVTFAGNHVGVTADGGGDGAGAAAYGVAVVDAASNRIGGTAPEDRNVVSGSRFANILLAGTADPQDATFRVWRNTIANSFVGTDASGGTGIAATPTTDRGIVLTGRGVNAWVPDATPTTPHPDGNHVLYNVVAGHAEGGILAVGDSGDGGEPLPAADTWVAWNIVGHGTQATGLLAGGGDDSIPEASPSLATGGAGIQLGDATEAWPTESSFVEHNAVTQSAVGIELALGASETAAQNRVWGNSGPGIRFTSFANVIGNETWDNGGPGIEADVPSAEPLPWITLDDVDGTLVQGAADLPVPLPSPAYVCVQTAIAFYSNDACDPSGSGEGRELVETFSFDGCPSSFALDRVEASYSRPWLTATASWTLGVDLGAGILDLPPVGSDFSNCVADPLPEPGAAWMLASGAGLVVVLARRRVTPRRSGTR